MTSGDRCYVPRSGHSGPPTYAARANGDAPGDRTTLRRPRALFDRLTLAQRLRAIRAEAEARRVDIDDDLAVIERRVAAVERRLARLPAEDES